MMASSTGLLRFLPVVVAIGAMAIGILILAIPATTGGAWPAWTGLDGKTAWDLANLVIVPVSLAVIAFLFSDRQRLEDREIARAQREQDLRMAEQQRSTDNEIALNREREEALQAYLSTMTELILGHDLADAKVAAIAQARTISLLSRLDGNRRSAVLEFLVEAGLVAAEKPTIRLSGADLSNMQGVRFAMTGVSLSGANLSKSRLAHASIRSSDLRYADLTEVDLSDADLFNTDLCGANLWRTDFSRAILVGANLSKGIPSRASLSPAKAKADAREAEENWLAKLADATFERAKYSYMTKWPAGFDPKVRGAFDIGG
jgi:uncharacterized protein YjbI with pentapeptide repeats